MKKLIAGLLVLLLLLVPLTAVADELPAEDEEILLSEVAADDEVGEIEALDMSGLVDPEGEPRIPEVAPAGEITEAASVPESTFQGEESAQEEPPVQEEPSPFTDPISAQTIEVKKSGKKTVYLGIPYVLDVKDGIQSVKSGSPKVAEASDDGVLTLHKQGTAKLTIKNQQGKKYTLTLTVKGVPTPGDLAVKAKSGALTLSWSAAKFATRYLIQQSADGEEWMDCRLLNSDETSLDVTEFVTGATWFRIVAILGDGYGGTSEPISVLGAVTKLRVICQESYKEGPTNKMNVTWKASNGAVKYEVYHALLPSDNYKLIGTTKKTWYPVKRNATKLDAYRVKPVFGNLDLPISDPVTLWSGLEDNVLPPSDLTSKTGIILLVNKKAQVVTAYVKNAKGKYTLPLRHMICSSGKNYDRTKNGTYQLKGRKGEWYKYPSGTYIRWPSIYRSGYYFHSVLYKSKKRINKSTIRKLGTRQSLGCIRLKVLDAEWIYKNCPKGTTVYICDGSKKEDLRDALKPKTVKVSGF